MTEQELELARRRKWRWESPPASAQEAQQLLESVGLCLLRAQKGAPSLPVLAGAAEPSDPALPVPEGFTLELLRQRQAFEGRIFASNVLLMAASVFPYFYALTGDRNPEQESGVVARAGKLSRLAADVYAAIRKQGGATKRRLRDDLGGEPSQPALDRALGELWSRLLIGRVDYTPADGASWDVLYRWAPDEVKQGIRMSVAEALSGLVSRYLDAVMAAEQKEVESFFSLFIPRSRVKETVNALLAAREVSFCTVGRRTLLELTPPVEAVHPRMRRATGSLKKVAP